MKKGGLVGLAFAVLFSLNASSQSSTFGEYFIPKVQYLIVSERSFDLNLSEINSLFLGKASEQYVVNPGKMPTDLRNRFGAKIDDVRTVVKYSAGRKEPLESIIYFDQRGRPILIGLPMEYSAMLFANGNPRSILIKTLARGQDGKFDLLFDGFGEK